MSLTMIVAALATANSAATASSVQVETPGAYVLSGMVVMLQARDPLYPDALDMGGIDSQKHLLAIIAPMNADAAEALLRATRLALLQRISQSSGEMRRLLRLKLHIVEGVMKRLKIDP